MIDSHVHLNRDEFDADREAVLAAARAAGARLHSVPLPHWRGPAGEDLAIDVAALGGVRQRIQVVACEPGHAETGAGTRVYSQPVR